jgi:hypothetical protein
LLWKFKLLSKECDEIKAKLESNETKTSNSFELVKHLSLVKFLSPR